MNFNRPVVRLAAAAILWSPFIAPTSAISAAPIKILFLGDSLTEGFSLPKEQSFPSLIEKELKTNFGNEAIVVVNGGISGSTSASGVGRLRWHLRAKPRPRILVLALGANDGLRGLSTQAMADNLSETITLAQGKGIKVLLAGMQIPPNYGQEYTEKFRSTFPTLRDKYKLVLIPFLLEGVAAQPKLNLSDRIHPNAEGYKVVAKTVLKYLRPLVKETIGEVSRSKKR